MDEHVQCTCTSSETKLQSQQAFSTQLMRTAGSLVMECPAMVAGQEEYAYVNRVKPGSQYDTGASVASRAS